MNNYLQTYKPFLIFLTKFFLTYVVLTLIYKSFLNTYDKALFEIDFFTEVVANQSNYLINLVGVDSIIELHQNEATIKMIVNNKYVAKIVEGCNAISVTILFVAFVIAFKGTFKKTVSFLFFGVLFIHVLNIIRVAVISVALYHFPLYQQILHDVVFPLFIYGVVFLLWVIWVSKYSVYAKKNSK